MEFKQEISKRDYKRAILKHYFAFGFTYINPILGIILIGVFLYKIISHGVAESTSYLFLIGGVFLLLRPWMYVSQIASIHRKGLMKFEINNDDQIIISQNEKSSSFSINEMYAYADRGEFFFLYLTKYRFHVIDKREAGQSYLSHLMIILNKHGIQKKK